MLIMKLVVNNELIVKYDYYPEGKEIKGTVIYYKEGGTFEIIQASNDEFKSYAFHSVSRLRKFLEIGAFREETQVAWC